MVDRRAQSAARRSWSIHGHRMMASFGRLMSKARRAEHVVARVFDYCVTVPHCTAGRRPSAPRCSAEIFARYWLNSGHIGPWGICAIGAAHIGLEGNMRKLLLAVAITATLASIAEAQQVPDPRVA